MDKMAEKMGGGVEVGAGLLVPSWLLGEVCSCIEQAHIHFPRIAIILSAINIALDLSVG
mgnify:CR=1 FL=1